MIAKLFYKKAYFESLIWFSAKAKDRQAMPIGPWLFK